MACGTSSSPAEEESASWTTAKRVSSEQGNNQQNASVAITTNNGGYTSLVYEEYNPLTHFYEIYHTSTIIGNVNKRTNDFGHIQKISRERRGNATLPKLALTTVEGQIQQSVVWQQYDGRQTIGLRGYPNSSLTPSGGGTVYNKFVLEIRYPITLKPSASIYVLGFLEGGNTFNDLDKFDPFLLKRSTGLGLRLFMPSFGLLGIDFAHGFDDVPNAPGTKSGWQTHFTIGQQF